MVTKGTMASRCITAFMIMALAVVTVVSTTGVTVSLRLAATIVAIGGTGNPSGQKPDVTQLLGGSLAVGRTAAYIETPQQLWPVNGTMSLNKSLAVGTPLAIEGIRRQTDTDVTYVGVSQGAAVLGLAVNYFIAHPDEAPSPDQVQFYLVSSPIRPNGGILVRLRGITIPVFDIGPQTPSQSGPYKVVDTAWAYDLYANAPLYPTNLLSVVNAFFGVYNPTGTSIHGTDPDYTNPDYEVRTEVVGNTTYHTLIPKHLPMLQPLMETKLRPLAELIEPLVKVWVNAGYYKNDPAADPGTVRPFELFMPLENIARALQQTPQAIVEGMKTIPRNLGVRSPAADRRQPVLEPEVEPTQEQPQEEQVSTDPVVRPVETDESVSTSVADSVPSSDTPETSVQQPALSSASESVDSSVISDDTEAQVSVEKPDQPKTSRKAAVSHSEAISSPKDAVRPGRKAWKPGDGVKRVLERVHRAMHPTTKKENAPSASSPKDSRSSAADSSDSASDSS